jgi:diadenosine tetraphosphate (Ap4A) HIT family hydrolase
MFQLHARLAEDSVHITDLPLSQLRLARDARFPWAILVPAKPDLREVHDLAPEDQGRLMAEIVMVSRALERLHGPDKINLGALGNLVPQLHVHVIARFVDDAAWPGLRRRRPGRSVPKIEGGGRYRGGVIWFFTSVMVSKLVTLNMTSFGS